MNAERFDSAAGDRSLLDELLRAGVPEVKLALGELIDRENVRPLPPRYARLLPATELLVLLRADAADAVRPVAADLERELTDSCNRHGSLYDRTYRVRLERAEDPDAPLYTVEVVKEEDAAGAEAAAAVPDLAQPPMAAAPAATAARGWEEGRWILVVEGDAGDREVFRLSQARFTVGRRADGSAKRADVAISDAPHVSRRQLALEWEEREGAPGFRVYNLGLNAVHLPGREIAGAHTSAEHDLAGLPEQHTGWLPPGVPLRIGERGPRLRIEEVAAEEDDVPVDPDATVFE